MAWQLGSANDGEEWRLGVAVDTDTTNPTLLAGPTRANILPTSGAFQGVPSKNATIRFIVGLIDSTEPLESAFDATGAGTPVTAFVPFTIPVTGQTQRTLRKIWIEIKDPGGLRNVYSLPILFPPTGYAYVELGTLATAGDRITATADFAPGDAIAWGNLTGPSGTVTVTSAGTFIASASVLTFGAVAGNFTDGWQTGEGTQTVAEPIALGFSTDVTYAPNQASLVLPDLAGADGVVFIVRESFDSARILESGTCDIVAGRFVGALTSASGSPGETIRMDFFWSQTIAGNLLRLSIGGDVVIAEV